MTKTATIVTVSVIILGIYDLWILTFGGVDDSISKFMQNTAFKSPVISFTVGFICGHIFGYMKP